MDRIAPNHQKKYRQKQAAKGLTRFEIQIPSKTKAKFDTLVETVAEEYIKPHSKKQRITLARIQVFEEITQGIQHDFFELQDQIEALKDEIRALSPQFFKTHTTYKTPLPEAILALPDDPKKLKSLLAKLYQDLQTAQLTATEQKRRAQQFEALYDTTSTHNDSLQAQLDIKNEEVY